VSTQPSGTIRFRARLLVAMMFIIACLTGAALFIAQRHAAANFERETKEDFKSQVAAINSERTVRLASLTERCRQLAGKPRIVAAFEDGAPDVLYPNVRDELRDILGQNDAPDDPATGKLRARFCRVLDEKGAVIPVNAEGLGALGFEESALALPAVAVKQEVGYVVARDPAGREAIDEIIATPIILSPLISHDPNAVVAALVLGFDAADLGGEGQSRPGLKSGLWLNGHLHLPGVPAAVVKSITAELKVTTATPSTAGTSLPVEIGGVPYLLLRERLNPDSRFPPADEVCLYSRADALAEQRADRWEIVGIGAALLLAGLAASHILAARLSKPVETLEVVSAENVVQRERAQAALDVTNEELRVRNAELQKALAELEAAHHQVVQQERLRALGQMASGIAHDFNNALVPILGFCELLQLSPDTLNDRQKSLSYLETIQTAARDAASVVARLREFYRANEADEKFVAVNLKRLVGQVVKMTQPKWKDQALANGATVKVVADFQDVPSVCGEESALREVLTNLVFNAVDAMPGGGVITIRTRQAGDHGILEVADSGTGMTEDVRRRCLEPFFSTKGERGTGLGLSMVFGIVQRHSGTIDLQSEVGRGTTFIISLPLYREAANTAVAGPAVATRALRVLVVDDEAPVRDLLSAALAHDGHSVEVAEQGVEGLRRFMAGKFDLVVTDKAMPGMSGDQMATAIKQVAPRTPIILLTGFGHFLDKESMPAIDVLASKPVSISSLRDAIARALAAAA